MTQAERLQLLEVPSGPIDAVIDTDAYNEIDDQFAISYLLASGDKITTKAIYAAPFLNHRSSSPEDGMEKSYQEILKLLSFSHREELLPLTFRGSCSYLPDEKTPVVSPAAEHLAKLAMGYSQEHPLFVVAIGAITNVASALLLEPEIRDRMVLVWLGGHALDYRDTKEFNLIQDVAAARVVFGCGVPLVQLPCMGVVSSFTISKPELLYWLQGKNPLCDFLVKNAIEEADSYAFGKPWTRVIWDVTAVAWLLNDNNRFMESRLIPAPVPEYDGFYAFAPTNYLTRYVYFIKRDALMEDLIGKLAR